MRYLHIMQYDRKKYGEAMRDNSSLMQWMDQFIVTARLAANQACRSQFGMDIDHTRLLRIIMDNPGRPVNWVVRESYLDRTLVSRAISKFAKQKLVERSISDDDARQFLLNITPAGEALVKEANAMREAMELEVISVLDDDERRNFELCLAKLAKWAPDDLAKSQKTRRRSKAA